MRQEKVYLAGKITGDPSYKQKFSDAESFLERGGYIVLNPSFLPAGLRYEDYMRICFSMIDVADCVFFLMDWRESKGAQLERHYCELIGKKIISVEPTLTMEAEK